MSSDIFLPPGVLRGLRGTDDLDEEEPELLLGAKAGNFSSFTLMLTLSNRLMRDTVPIIRESTGLSSPGTLGLFFPWLDSWRLHSLPSLKQREQGVRWSHLTFDKWHSWQAMMCF